jgi:hypothetical protein
MSPKPRCHFCGDDLKGRADTTWDGGGVRVDDCARCGVYHLPQDLVPVVDGLSDPARAEIAAYLADLFGLEDAEPMRFTAAFFGL